MGRGVGEGGRVMAGQGQNKPSALARDESGMEVQHNAARLVLGRQRRDHAKAFAQIPPLVASLILD